MLVDEVSDDQREGVACDDSDDDEDNPWPRDHRLAPASHLHPGA